MNPIPIKTPPSIQIRPTTTRKRREEFLQFMDQIVAEAPGDRQVQVIWDNYGTHKKMRRLADASAQRSVSLYPTSAGWLNQGELWLGLRSRETLRGASFMNVNELRHAIAAFIAVYNPKAKPFKWRQREVKGAPL